MAELSQDILSLNVHYANYHICNCQPQDIGIRPVLTCLNVAKSLEEHFFKYVFVTN